MQKYRFVGTEFTIGNRKFTRLGDLVEMTPEQRRDAGPRAPLVHDALFQQIGFTEQELSLYAYPAQRVDSPAAFQAKLREAWAAVGREPKETKPEVK